MTFTDYPGFTIRQLPPGAATGAVDSTKAHLKAKPRSTGRALKTGVPMTPSKHPKLRKRKR